jgi:hypothetical protein
MDDAIDRTAELVPATLDNELRLVREAIALVASGRSPRTVVAGLRLSDALLEPAAGIARDARVALTPIRRPDDSGVDIAIEALPG